MKELTQAQKALAFDLWMELSEKGFGKSISAGTYQILCNHHLVEVDFAGVARHMDSAAGRFMYDTVSVVKHLVSAKKLPTTPANST